MIGVSGTDPLQFLRPFAPRFLLPPLLARAPLGTINKHARYILGSGTRVLGLRSCLFNMGPGAKPVRMWGTRPTHSQVAASAGRHLAQPHSCVRLCILACFVKTASPFPDCLVNFSTKFGISLGPSCLRAVACNTISLFFPAGAASSFRVSPIC